VSARARARLARALQSASDGGDVLAWLNGFVALYRQTDDEERRRALLDELIQATKTLRSQHCSRVGRLKISERVDRVLGPVLEEHITSAETDPAQLLRLAEAGRARMLLDLMAGRFVEPEGDDRDAIQEIEQRALGFGRDTQDGLVWDELRLASELPIADKPRTVTPVADAENAYREAAAGFVGVAPLATLAQLQQSLVPGEVLLEYVIPFHPLHPAKVPAVVVVTATDATLVPLPVERVGPGSGFTGRITTDDHAPLDASPLGELVMSMRTAVQRGADDEATGLLRMLDELLLQPIRDLGVGLESASSLVVVPHRLLHPIPWAALTDQGGHRLIEACALTLAPSGSAWVTCRQRARRHPETALVLADPQLAYAGHDALPSARDEASRVKKSLTRDGITVDVRCGVQARGQDVALLGDPSHPAPDILHFATHGDFPGNDAMDEHRVLLARSQRHPGPITARDIRRLDLRATSLVVLSVCDGGLYKFAAGDEPLGLIPAFLAAGAKTVIGTLWQVGDDAGRDLVSRVFDHLLAKGPAGAMRAAILELSHDASVPIRDWASFTCAGDGSLPD
jgi:CHAT domain-containing protein